MAIPLPAKPETSPEDTTLALLAQSYLHSPQHLNTYVLPQFRHRVALMSRFNIPAGAKILELGCGQGETTLVLAHLVGPTGHITGVDPARLDYGHPITVSAARNHILASPLGARISFHAIDPLAYLSALPAGHSFDFIILSHSLWYFPSKRAVLNSLAALGPYAPRLLVAEYSFEGRLEEQRPHVLAAKCQAVFYDEKTPEQRAATEPNVRAAPSPMEVKEMAGRAGWGVVSGREGMVTPGEDVKDGQWEVSWVCFYKQFWDEVESVLVGKEEVKREVERLKAETRAELERVNKQAGIAEEKDVSRCRTMDVWWAEFEKL
ncbi:S-adenosyl-L-methionine-dependent methyltransferase [Morchella snyderi]|nr:S-adenosyl-L-methionine-dependent methyltransferase [Morchella snyderi]